MPFVVPPPGSVDPQPETRCRCVHRPVHVTGPARRALGLARDPADDYYDRCPARATREDGLRDQCRRPLHDQCAVRCCRCSDQPARRIVTDPRTPCMAPADERSAF